MMYHTVVTSNIARVIVKGGLIPFLKSGASLVLKIVFVWMSVYVHACVWLPPRLSITGGMKWCDMEHLSLVKLVLQALNGSYGIVSRHGI